MWGIYDGLKKLIRKQKERSKVKQRKKAESC